MRVLANPTSGMFFCSGAMYERWYPHWQHRHWRVSLTCGPAVLYAVFGPEWHRMVQDADWIMDDFGTLVRSV